MNKGYVGVNGIWIPEEDPMELPQKPVIINKTKLKVSKYKNAKIRTLFQFSVYNFPWAGWLKDRRGYYTETFSRKTKSGRIYKIGLPGEKFGLSVHTNKFDMPTRIYVVKP